MKRLLITILFSSVCITNSFESSSKEYKNLDRKIAKVLMRPTKEKWDKMLEAVEFYSNKLKDPGLIFAQDCEKNKVIIQGILRDGCPNFVNIAVDEDELLNEVEITKSQLKRFYELRDDTKKTWEEILTVCAKQNITQTP
jgi:predicted NUDIX family phosphoesterase